ncbi:hypothetical protein L2E82_15178 [Cichorium intybus]|uniref:Uncharacterized protein n=1 Tax=Cichorium intybus TaxID=13427 RepID=A0ACB9F209_CICIN|nr:hypothetical protein L2E82_15178 [Cichorium intybus]
MGVNRFFLIFQFTFLPIFQNSNRLKLLLNFSIYFSSGFWLFVFAYLKSYGGKVQGEATECQGQNAKNSIVGHNLKLDQWSSELFRA